MTEIAADAPTIPAEQPTERARRRRLTAWYAAQDKRELAVWGAVLVLALIVRFIALGERAFHHDESQDAYFSYLFRQTGDYEYNPLLHGPLRFYLTALMYVTFGDTDFTARLAPALMGAAMIPMCWGLRSLIGRGAALAAAIFFAFGASYLYFSRFAREDIYFASLSLALVVVIWRGIDHPRKYHPALIGILIALLFATKETMFISLFVMGTFFIFCFAIPSWRRADHPRAHGARLGRLGLVRGRVRAHVHAAVHDVPDPPHRALRRCHHGPGVLARPARGAPRR